jgi:hypothetical protein
MNVTASNFVLFFIPEGCGPERSEGIQELFGAVILSEAKDLSYQGIALAMPHGAENPRPSRGWSTSS